MIPPEARDFCAIDWASGYYQVEIDERYRELFMFVVPQGKFHICRLPQGTSSASNLFNIATNDKIHNVEGIVKNLDDLLVSGRDIKEIEPLIRKILKIFRKKNMKIKLSKFEISQKVTFGRCNVQASSKKDSVTISPEDNKIEELLAAPHPKTRKLAQSLVGSLNQLAAWCPGLKRKMPK